MALMLNVKALAVGIDHILKERIKNMQNRFKFRANIKQYNQIIDVAEIDFENETIRVLNNDNMFGIVKNKDNEIIFVGNFREALHSQSRMSESRYIRCQEFYKFSEIDLIQCTGLTDKNGKLIYEKDYALYKNNKFIIGIDKYCGITLTNILNG